jgi:hypothetical protein
VVSTSFAVSKLRMKDNLSLVTFAQQLSYFSASPPHVANVCASSTSCRTVSSRQPIPPNSLIHFLNQHRSDYPAKKFPRTQTCLQIPLPIIWRALPHSSPRIQPKLQPQPMNVLPQRRKARREQLRVPSYSPVRGAILRWPATIRRHDIIAHGGKAQLHKPPCIGLNDSLVGVAIVVVV